jgi:hypothetical protein
MNDTQIQGSQRGVSSAQLDRDFELLEQRRKDHIALGDWVQKLAPWQVKADLTWRYERGVSIWSAQRGFEKFMRLDYPRLSYFYAIEVNPSRDGHHVHAMLADTRNLYRKEMWLKWFKRSGRALIEPIRDYEDATAYVAKYTTKGCGWWDVKLQWHHQQALTDQRFILKGGKWNIERKHEVERE